ncbi:MAG TPA: PSD1 and planctomycete cytochrome C domain-containing protein [Opitutaceae bacterium]|jgi:hypothetical protein|nr:PSD1 and planctomycete cytochrome C domain-containing protein [Opitutaceae bacterium]
MSKWSHFLVVALAASGTAGAVENIPANIQFNRDVRPIMANTCFKCHGPDLKANKADLRLDLPDKAKAERKDKTGRVYRAIVPGKPAESEIWRRISSGDPGQVMPPPDSLHLLSERDQRVMKRWIEQGAVYEQHWAYMPPKKAPVPQAGPGARNEIDHFIMKELAERGLSPSPEADPRVLLRRVSLDLLGLPPTPEETERFLGDTQPGAYERLVDRLLASPHFGERMAVGWLDLARFADTVGFHGDQLYNNFPYRDYVIDAINRNEPYDQFTREQLAGDLLPNATDRDRVASGFNRLNMVTREGGAQPKEYIAKYAADRVRTVSTTWLGSTMACCECHDHKYDPFKAKDFYALGAYFADIKQYGVYEDYTYTPEPELKGYTNDSPFPPEIEVGSVYLKERAARLARESEARISRVGAELQADPALAGLIKDWTAQIGPQLATEGTGWVTYPAQDVASSEEHAKVWALPGGQVEVNGHVTTWSIMPEAGPLATVRLQVLPDPDHDGRTNLLHDPFSLTFELALYRKGEPERLIMVLSDAYSDHPTKSYFNGQLLTSVILGWRSVAGLEKVPQAATYILENPIVLQKGDRLEMRVLTNNLGRVGFSVSPLGLRAPGTRPIEEVLGALKAQVPTPEQSRLLASEYFLSTGGPSKADFQAAQYDVREIAACRDGKAFTTVTVATTPRVARILPRGDWQNETGAVVEPAVPGFLNKAPAPDGSARQTRLDLANWITSRDNPLTARAYMNRLWRQFFGTGLSAFVDDIGTQGEYPSHPELLDWLAVDFMDRGWDVKAMVKLIVTSATYRQSSNFRQDLAEADPNNRLLARQSPRRLDAEFVRDNALAASGLINLDVGGPSVYPYQPDGYYAALQFPSRDYVADTDERQYRRGVYIHWQRTFLQPMLANFDAPSREECVAARNISSTPQQALTLLNDPTFVEAARGLAEEALANRAEDDFAGGLNEAYLRLLARAPSERERVSLKAFFDGQLAYYRGKPEEAEKAVRVGQHVTKLPVDAPTLAAWTSVARVLINLNETIVRY